jgi:hypothetical protein
MTSGQAISQGNRQVQDHPLARALLLILGLFASGCTTSTYPRQTLVSRSGHEQLWAVVPPRNESGISIVDTARVADMITKELEQVKGVSALPVQRVLLGLQQLQLATVTGLDDVAALMRLLGADGLIVGTVTAYDPYPPPVLGLALELHLDPAPPDLGGIDPVEISRTTTGQLEAGPGTADRVFQTSGVFDGRDQQTLTWLRHYAETRHDPSEPYGPDIYLVSMDLFTQFVSHRLLRDLLRRQQLRNSAMAASGDAR